MPTDHTANVKVFMNTTKADLLRQLRDVPQDARITVSHREGDRPFDPSETFIRATWSTE